MNPESHAYQACALSVSATHDKTISKLAKPFIKSDLTILFSFGGLSADIYFALKLNVSLKHDTNSSTHRGKSAFPAIPTPPHHLKTEERRALILVSLLLL